MTTFKTLADCVRKVPPTEKKQRPYRVKYGKETVYVVSNSPGNAALEVCEVETVSQREQLEAFRSLNAPPLPFKDSKVEGEIPVTDDDAA